jgi:hypothetical protein
VGAQHGHDIVVVGASAAVFVVLHITPDAASALPDSLSRAGGQDGGGLALVQDPADALFPGMPPMAS